LFEGQGTDAGTESAEEGTSLRDLHSLVVYFCSSSTDWGQTDGAKTKRKHGDTVVVFKDSEDVLHVLSTARGEKSEELHMIKDSTLGAC
jgi:hypothetical protein